MIDLETVWNPLDLTKTEREYRDLLMAVKEQNDVDHSREAEILSQIARALAAQNHCMEARLLLQEAERIVEEFSASCSIQAKIRVFLEKGRLCVQEKTPSLARQHFSQAWALSVQAKEDYFVVDVAQMMAAIDTPKMQQEWIKKAIEVAETSAQEKTKKFLGTLYSIHAQKLNDLHQYDAALEVFQKAGEALMREGSKQEAFHAKFAAGKVLRFLKRFEEALQVQKKLLEELRSEGSSSGRVFEEVAECYNELKQADQAQVYFELAYRDLSSSEWVKDDQPLRLKRLKELGKVKDDIRGPNS